MRAEFLRQVVAESISEGDFDYEETNGETAAATWIAAAMTAPLFSPRRTVVVRHLLRAGPPEDALKGMEVELNSLPGHSRLILVVDDEQGEDDRQKRLATMAKKWATTIKKAGGAVHIFELDPKTAKEKLKGAFANHGLKISQLALQKLYEMTGESYSRCLEELDKLVLHAGDETQIRDADIEKLVVATREYKVFNMLNAIVAGQHGEAVRQLRIIAETPAKFEDMAFRVIFPTLRKEARLMWQARAILDANANVAAIPAELANRFPKQNRFDQESDWKRGRTLQAAQKVTLRHIAQILQLLDETDEKLKGGEIGVGALDAIERMVLEMCGLFSSQKAVRA